MNNAITELFRTNKIRTTCVEIVVTINVMPVKAIRNIPFDRIF
jgi:hypothetical protein